jgi:hypothetical protein
MAIATATKNAKVIVPIGTSNAAAATTRGVADLRTAFGGFLTLKITNGATGPTVQAVGRVLVAHNNGATPTAAPAGADWKTIFEFGGGVTANAITEQNIIIDQSVMHIEVEFTGNTAQPVTVEAIFSELTSISNN